MIVHPEKHVMSVPTFTGDIQITCMKSLNVWYLSGASADIWSQLDGEKEWRDVLTMTYPIYKSTMTADEFRGEAKRLLTDLRQHGLARVARANAKSGAKSKAKAGKRRDIQSPQTKIESMVEDLRRRFALTDADDAVAFFPRHAKYILHVGLEQRPKRVLEIGLGTGFSAAILQSLGTVENHVIIELRESTATPRTRKALRNLDRFRDKDRELKLFWRDSDLALPVLCLNQQQFDFIMIDGGHRFDNIFVDFHYTRKLLRRGGVVFIDDVWMPAIRSVVDYIETNLAHEWIRVPTADCPSLAIFRYNGPQEARPMGEFHPFRTDWDE